jgi:hypothetical protein
MFPLRTVSISGDLITFVFGIGFVGTCASCFAIGSSCQVVSNSPPVIFSILRSNVPTHRSAGDARPGPTGLVKRDGGPLLARPLGTKRPSRVTDNPGFVLRHFSEGA